VNPFNPALSYAISSFDVKNNFVVSYEYQLPFDQFFHPNRLTSGWSVSGITRFCQRLPGNHGEQWRQLADRDQSERHQQQQHRRARLHRRSASPERESPKEREQLFRYRGLPHECARHPGNAKRRFFYGPGADNFDMAVAKKLALTESKSLLFRVEAFNVFNHTQFNGPTSVDGDIGSSTFGNVISAAAPTNPAGSAEVQFLILQSHVAVRIPRCRAYGAGDHRRDLYISEREDRYESAEGGSFLGVTALTLCIRA
jgi:hypothetical protein